MKNIRDEVQKKINLQKDITHYRFWIFQNLFEIIFLLKKYVKLNVDQRGKQAATMEFPTHKST